MTGAAYFLTYFIFGFTWFGAGGGTDLLAYCYLVVAFIAFPVFTGFAGTGLFTTYKVLVFGG